MTEADLLYQEVRDAARRCYVWLRDHQELADAASPHGLTRALEWLIAAWICEQGFGLGGSCSLARKGSSQIVLRLNTHDHTGAFNELFTSDALRVTLAHTITTRHGFDCGSLTAFVGGLAASLSPASKAAVDGSDLFETQLLTMLAGFGGTLRLPCLDALIGTSTLGLLQADELTVRLVASQVITGSAYGTHDPVISASLRRRLIEVISVWLLDFARGYRLDNVALLMRSLGCLGEVARVRGAMRFLLAQQHRSGHFGYFGPEAAQAKRLSPGWDEAANLQLPVTFACLWALSECSNRDFRLLGQR